MTPNVSVLVPDAGDWCKNEAKKHLLNLKVYYRYKCVFVFVQRKKRKKQTRSVRPSMGGI